MTGPAIYVFADGGGFAVEVAPAPDGDSPDARFDTHKSARGWAGGLRLTKGWPIIEGRPPAASEHGERADG